MNYQDVLLNQIQVPNRFLSNYHHFGLNETEAMIIIQIHRFLQNNIDFPTPSELSNCLSIDEKTCASILRKLIQKDLLSIKQLHNDQDQLTEAYSLEPLWQKLYTNTYVQQEQEVQGEESVGTIFILFEQEFGRPISPFEVDMINTWLDEDRIVPTLIKAALREAVLMSKLNFKYIDRILREWKKKGIHSVEQAREASKAFRNRQLKPTYTEKRDTSFYYNWLEGEE